MFGIDTLTYMLTKESLAKNSSYHSEKFDGLINLTAA
jgi:hypothetical protein